MSTLVVFTSLAMDAEQKRDEGGKFATSEAAAKAVPSKGHAVVMQHAAGHHEVHSFKSEPEDQHLDKLAKKMGHKKGGSYPNFSTYHNGEETGGGGGPNSGALDSAATLQGEAGRQARKLARDCMTGRFRQ